MKKKKKLRWLDFHVSFMCILAKPVNVDWMTTLDEDSALFT